MFHSLIHLNLVTGHGSVEMTEAERKLDHLANEWATGLKGREYMLAVGAYKAGHREGLIQPKPEIRYVTNDLECDECACDMEGEITSDVKTSVEVLCSDCVEQREAEAEDFDYEG